MQMFMDIKIYTITMKVVYIQILGGRHLVLINQLHISKSVNGINEFNIFFGFSLLKCNSIIYIFIYLLLLKGGTVVAVIV